MPVQNILDIIIYLCLQFISINLQNKEIAKLGIINTYFIKSYGSMIIRNILAICIRFQTEFIINTYKKI